jgi:hypothetical protein
MNGRKPFTGSFSRIVPTKWLPPDVGEMFCGREGILWVSEQWVEKLTTKTSCSAAGKKPKTD